MTSLDGKRSFRSKRVVLAILLTVVVLVAVTVVSVITFSSDSVHPSSSGRVDSPPLTGSSPSQTPDSPAVRHQNTPATPLEPQTKVALNRVGIVNRGNDCYAISVLQALWRIPAYRDAVRSLSQRETNPTIKGIQAIFEQIERGELVQFKSEDGSVNAIPPEFQPDKQHDAMEYMQCVFRIILYRMSREECKSLAIELRTPSDEHLPHTSLPRQCCLRLEFPLATNQQIFYMNGMLDSFFSTTSLNSHTGKEEPVVTPKYKLSSVPPVLVLQLMRFSEDKSARDPNQVHKLNYTVHSPNVIDLKKYMTEASSKTEPTPTKYQLKMFIEHRGEANNGHYVIYVHDWDSNWYLLDNQTTTKIPLGKIDEKLDKAYVLFYEKCDSVDPVESV